MKTLDTLLKEQNISENTQSEQPVNEAAGALIAGLFGALAMGIGALFKGAKKAWEKADEPSKEDEAKAKENEKNMDDSTKAAYNNAIDELDDRDDNKSEEDKTKEKELEEIEDKDSKEQLEKLKGEAERLIHNLSKEDCDIKYPDYCVKVHRKLKTLSEEVDDEEGKELASKLKKKTDKHFGSEEVDEVIENEKVKRITRCYFSQIAVNASKAYSDGGEAFKILADLVKDASGAAKEKLDKEGQDTGDDEQGSDFGLQTMVGYVIKIGLGLSKDSLENELFLKMIDDIQFVGALEVLIGATMIINASQYKTEQLETYQKMFNTLGLNIQLSGK